MKFKINTEKAIAVIEKNLAEHIRELDEAKLVWTEKVRVALIKLRDAVDREGLKASNSELSALFYQPPQDRRADYSRYLGGLKLHKENGSEIIELDEQEYDNLFNDNWDWRVAASTSNKAYSKS